MHYCPSKPWRSVRPSTPLFGELDPCGTQRFDDKVDGLVADAEGAGRLKDETLQASKGRQDLVDHPRQVRADGRFLATTTTAQRSAKRSEPSKQTRRTWGSSSRAARRITIKAGTKSAD